MVDLALELRLQAASLTISGEECNRFSCQHATGKEI